MKSSKLYHLKSLLSDSLIYGLSGIVTSFIGVFLIPIYTKVFDPADYGVIALLGTTGNILFLLTIFNLDNAAAVWFWSNTEDRERRATFSSWFWFLFCISVVVALAFIILPGFWSQLILRTTHYEYLIRLFGVTVLFGSFQKIVNIWYRMKRMPLHAVGFALGLSLITIGLNILFIIHLKWGLKGTYSAQSISALLGFVGCVVVLRKNLSLSFFSMSRLKEMLVFSLPLLPSSLMFWLMNSASSYFLSFYSTKSEIGLYMMGSMIAGVFNLVIWAFMQAWGPFAMSISKSEEAKSIYSNILELYFVIGLLAVFFIAFFAEDILRVFTNERYLGSKHVIFILSASILFQGIPQILSIANAITRNNVSYAQAVIVGSLLTVILFNIFIPWFGKEGAAISVLLGNIVVPIYHGVKVQRSYPIPYNFKRMVRALGIIAMFLVIGFWIVNLTWSIPVLVIIKLTLVMACASSLVFFYRKTLGGLVANKTRLGTP